MENMVFGYYSLYILYFIYFKDLVGSRNANAFVFGNLYAWYVSPNRFPKPICTFSLKYLLDKPLE